MIGFFCFLSVALGVESLHIRSGETITGTIESISSIDKWSFYGEAGDRVVICAMKTSGSMSGAYLKLYDKDGSVESQNSGSSGIDKQLKKTGLYTLSVEANAPSGTGNYSLTFQKIPGPVSAPGDLDGGTMIPGTKYSGTIDALSDLDAYQFYGQTGDIVKVYTIKRLTEKFMQSDVSRPFGVYAREQGWRLDKRTKDVESAISLGKLLAKRLQIRNEERVDKSTRLRSGKIDKRLLHEIGFDNYEIPRFSWIPKMDCIILDRMNQPPKGGGEPAIIAVGAVIANAVHDATSARLYRMPMTPARVLEALKKV